MKKYIVHVTIEIPTILEVEADNGAQAIICAEEAVSEKYQVDSAYVKVGATYEKRKK